MSHLSEDYPPDCEEWNIGDFLTYCGQHDLAPNPCNCGTYISCGASAIQDCPDTTVFNPCNQTCTGLVDAIQCGEFCCQPYWSLGCSSTTTTTTTTITPTLSSTLSSTISSTTSPIDVGSDTNWVAVVGGIFGAFLFFIIMYLICSFLFWRKKRWAETPDRHKTPILAFCLYCVCLPCSLVKSKVKTDINNKLEENDKRQTDIEKMRSPKYKLTQETPTAPSYALTPAERRRYRKKSTKFENTNIYPMDIVNLGSTLGRGAYGKVFKGKLRLSGNLQVEVAIKTSTRTNGAEDIVKEARVFQKLPSKHLNIVNLLGVCDPDDKEINPMLLLELCEQNLEKFLQKNREVFISGADIKSKVLKDTGEYSSKKLLRYSYQISRGMEFLEYHRIVHGDLAARNILLSNNGTVAKVSDFGLSRSLYASVEELSNASGGLPVRWMAPEVLMMRQVTNKSDIWSFGVLLWEIFSLGAVPYPDIGQIDLQFIQDLSDGVRELGETLYKVPTVQESFDAVRMSALGLNQDDRPSFEELSPRVWSVLEDASKDDYTRLERDYNRYISLINSSYEQLFNYDSRHGSTSM